MHRNCVHTVQKLISYLRDDSCENSDVLLVRLFWLVSAVNIYLVSETLPFRSHLRCKRNKEIMDIFRQINVISNY